MTVLGASLAATGCENAPPDAAAEEYERVACACADRACAGAASEKFYSVPRERRYLTKDAEANLQRMILHAESCVEKLPPSGPPRMTCAGVSGLKCPAGYRCVPNPHDPGDTDVGGTCVKHATGGDSP